jgi:hypothetical protein
MATAIRRVCIRGASVNIVYEFQIVGASAASSSSPLDIHHHLEQILRTWRSAAHWTMVVAYDGQRLNAHVVVQRHSATSRFDNSCLAWQRQLTVLLANTAVPQRHVWTAVKGSAARVYADVKVAAESYDATVTTVKTLARAFAGPRGSVSASSDWLPLAPIGSNLTAPA